MFLADRDVWVADRCTGRYCDLSGLENFDVWMNLTLDHIIPRCRGGDETAENKAIACVYCNNLKGSYIPVGTSREERIADARRHVQKKRERWGRVFDGMMSESGSLV
jgi:5-methylcytosine-specific restriction endonuclease McrA